jgi:hypothetical protein
LAPPLEHTSHSCNSGNTAILGRCSTWSTGQASRDFNEEIQIASNSTAYYASLYCAAVVGSTGDTSIVGFSGAKKQQSNWPSTALLNVGSHLTLSGDCFSCKGCHDVQGYVSFQWSTRITSCHYVNVRRSNLQTDISISERRKASRVKGV